MCGRENGERGVMKGGMKEGRLGERGGMKGERGCDKGEECGRGDVTNGERGCDKGGNEGRENGGEGV